MSDGSGDEVEIILWTSKDTKTIKLTFKSTRAMDTHDLIVVLEDYLQDLIRAYGAMPEDSSLNH